MLKVQLTRDLRKNILRGHPWVYREATSVKNRPVKACLCEVQDRKGKFVAWALFSPEGPLALRIFSTENKPPNLKYFERKMEQSWQMREPLRTEQTNAYRVFNGEGDFLPGMVCDLYDNVAVLQFDGDSCYEFWDQKQISEWLLQKDEVKTVYCKPRRSDSREALVFGEPLEGSTVTIKENDVQFLVNIEQGQKTGFFLDQRDNRNYLKSISKNQTVLNLFSYTGGFSMYAGLGGAQQVVSVDLAAPALELADQSWELNGLPLSQHKSVPADVFKFMETEKEKYDIVMVDPPSMTHSEKTKLQAVKTYTDLFAQASRLVQPGKHLVLSSCSSHISFEDFFSIIDEAMSKARRKAKIIKVSGQGIDHPIPHYCRELRYLKFVDLILD